MIRPRILVVDDEEGILEVCRDTLLHLAGAQVDVESDSRKALRRMEEDYFDLVVCDVRMPGVDGVDFLRQAKGRVGSDAAIIMLTGYPTVETAVACMKLGASDYLVKPFDPEDLLARARRELERLALRQENRPLANQLVREHRFDGLIGESGPMREVYSLIERAGPTDADILITGESGTGKELVARSLHARSGRKEGKFVPVDCGAIPENLLEGEFFGHERGAYTGASTTRLGLLEFAHGGTFFMDEICELSAALQTKLLRAVQERSFRRVGGQEEIAVDIRIVAATNRDVEQEVREKRFREDLYYRINVVRIHLPPLRERRDDIPLLVRHFLQRFGRELGKPVEGIEEEALALLAQAPWPGNVRELQNVLKRAIVLAGGPILGAEDLPDDLVAAGGEPVGEGSSEFYSQRARQIAAFEEEFFRKLLDQCAGDVVEAARRAQMPRATFYRFLKKHGLKAESFRAPETA